LPHASTVSVVFAMGLAVDDPPSGDLPFQPPERVRPEATGSEAAQAGESGDGCDSAKEAAAVEVQEEVQQKGGIAWLRTLDKGVPHMRKLRSEASIAKRKANNQRGTGSSVELLAQAEEYIREITIAVEARARILREAMAYVPKPWPADSQRRVALGAGRPLRVRRTFSKVLVMGIYHSCTNAAQKELEKRFDVEVVNDWHTGKEKPMWKHRVNDALPAGVDDDCLILLFVKEPHFWLKSCSKAERQFFELHPIVEDPKTGERSDAPPQTLQQLLGLIEHDAVTYPNAIQLWNDTVRSYFDDAVYPADRSVVVRSEDFLFRFHEVMDELANCGLREHQKGDRPEPLADRAKGHLECRTRDQALGFYADVRNLQSDFAPSELELVKRDSSKDALAKLGYAGPNPVLTWTSFFLVGSWNDWRDFAELKPIRGVGPACSCSIRVRKAPGSEEFQILQDRDWARRYFPGRMQGSGECILGPANAHGANWQVRVPAGCTRMQVTWDPRGERSLQCDFS